MFRVTKNCYGLEFHLKKERKIKRIKGILSACKLDWTENKKSDGSVSIRIYNNSETKIVKDICERYLHNKAFTWKWLNLSPTQAEVFLSEILLWDGCGNSNLYTSKETINLDVVNAIAAVNGKASRVSGNNVQFRREPFMTLGKEEKSTRRNSRQYEGRHTEVTCVSVKTGVFLMRQNGKTFIIGNCPGDWLYSRLGDLASKVTAALGEKIETETPTPEKKMDVPFIVRISIDDLNIRTGPGVSYPRTGIYTGRGAFTIVATSTVKGVEWGKLKSGAGWICLSYATRV